MEKYDKQRIEKLANISEAEYAELDRMIATAIELKGKPVQVKLARTLDEVRIGGKNSPLVARIYFFPWSVDDDVRGIVGWRPYGADEEVAAFQAQCTKYFSDGVGATSVVMHTAKGKESLR